MTSNISSGLAGLSLLTGANAFAAYGTGTSGTSAAFGGIETRAARTAKAQFTTPASKPIWSGSPASPTIAAIQAMKTIIDRPETGAASLPTDVQTDFTVYKALDRLRVLAQQAAASTTSSAERANLQKTFAAGLSDLRSFMATAPSDKLHLSFGQPTSKAESVAVTRPETFGSSIAGHGIATTRDAALDGVTGNEVLKITLTDSKGSDAVTVNLADAQQPPSVDSVSAAINAAIAAVPLRNPDGSVHLDDNGNPEPRWLVHFVPDKATDKWGFSIQRSGLEQVSVDQVGGKDSLVVSTGVTTLDAPTAARTIRFDDPEGALAQKTLGTLAATDRLATEAARTTKSTAPAVPATTTANGILVDPDGSTYSVGTTTGDLGSAQVERTGDLYVVKRDSEGAILWQKTLGSVGGSTGAAITRAADGGILVAGTVDGRLDGVTNDRDMIVTRLGSDGHEDWTTRIAAVGVDSAAAIVAGADGSIYAGGQSDRGGGDAFLVRLDGTGQVQQRRTIDSGGADAITALALDGSGNLLALGTESGTATLRRIDPTDISHDLATATLGQADARALAVGPDGSVAVGGATLAALPGGQVNAPGANRDGFVTRLSADLSSQATTYLATAGDDRVDSIAFANGALYAGGRTNDTLGDARIGSIDGFVARIDAADGSIGAVRQFGQAASRTDPVHVTADPGGDSVLGALGLHRGLQNGNRSTLLTASSSLRAGDSFRLRVNDGAVRTVTIGADDTLATLARRVSVLTSGTATVTTPTSGAGATLRITARSGAAIDLISGPNDSDALEKLGIAPGRLSMPTMTKAGAPKVSPGGRFGLNLTEGLSLTDKGAAATALERIGQAMSITQTGYRSLYWDQTKANLANGGTKTSAATEAAKAQVAQYQAALNRLTASSGTPGYDSTTTMTMLAASR